MPLQNVNRGDLIKSEDWNVIVKALNELDSTGNWKELANALTELDARVKKLEGIGNWNAVVNALTELDARLKKLESAVPGTTPAGNPAILLTYLDSQPGTPQWGNPIRYNFSLGLTGTTNQSVSITAGIQLYATSGLGLAALHLGVFDSAGNSLDGKQVSVSQQGVRFFVAIDIPDRPILQMTEVWYTLVVTARAPGLSDVPIAVPDQHIVD